MKLNALHNNITDAIIKLRNEYIVKLDMDIEEINNGYCVEFANKIVDLIDGATCMTDNYEEFGHQFIKYQNRYYDAEAPNGRSRWYDLPFYKKRRYARDGRKSEY